MTSSSRSSAGEEAGLNSCGGSRSLLRSTNKSVDHNFSLGLSHSWDSLKRSLERGSIRDTCLSTRTIATYDTQEQDYYQFSLPTSRNTETEGLSPVLCNPRKYSQLHTLRQFDKSYRQYLEYPKNLIQEPVCSTMLDSYRTRLLDAAAHVFTNEGEVATTFLEYDATINSKLDDNNRRSISSQISLHQADLFQ